MSDEVLIFAILAVVAIVAIACITSYFKDKLSMNVTKEGFSIDTENKDTKK